MAWWVKSAPIAELWNAVDRCGSGGETRRTRCAAQTVLYEGDNALEDRDDMRTDASLVTPDGFEIKLNVVESIVDTLVSHLATARPTPMVQTDGGDSKALDQRTRAQRFLDGTFQYSKAHAAMRRAGKDCFVWGTGLIKPRGDGSDVVFDRVFPWDLVVPTDQSGYGHVREMYAVTYLQRDHALELWPNAADQLRMSPSYRGARRDLGDDTIEIVEGWRLRSAHVIGTRTDTVVHEPWERNRFPVAAIRWKHRQCSWWGKGVVEQLEPIQREIWDVLYRLGVGRKGLGHPHVFVEEGSDLLPRQLTDNPLQTYSYRGRPPEIVLPQTIAPDVYKYLWDLVAQSWQLAGVSELAAMSKKPAGLNAGVALRAYQDAQSQRFQEFSLDFDALAVELGHLILDVAHDSPDEIYARVSDPDGLTRISLGDVEMDRDRFVLSIAASGYLRKTPPGRLQDVSDLLDKGLLSQDQARRLLDAHDLAGEVDPSGASYKLWREDVDAMTRGEPREPDEYMNLQQAHALTIGVYLQSKARNPDNPSLELLLAYISQCQDYMDRVAAAVPPAGPQEVPNGN
jgi:hypothetical protein